MSSAARSYGSITIEIIIAFAIFSLTLAAVILMLGGEAGGFLHESDERAFARDAVLAAYTGDFLSLVSTTTLETRNGRTYTLDQEVTDTTPCTKSVNITATTTQDYVSLFSYIGDYLRSKALGGDCPILPSMSDWTHVSIEDSLHLDAKGTAVDVLNGITYIGEDTRPYFRIIARDTFAGSIDLSAAPNDLDATNIGGKPYVFLALSATSSQLAVIDAADPSAPIVVATRTPLNVDPAGSFPQGWRVKYLDRMLYFVVRETKGAEFHIYDVSDPTFPIEKGSGNSIDITVNDIDVRDEWHAGRLKRYAYMAAARDGGEVAAYDVTNPSAISELSAARTDIPGNQDAQSLALVGNRLYIGRASVPSGADLYVYDISHLEQGLTLLGSVDVGAGVQSIEVLGTLAFLATGKSGKELQVWNVSDPTHMTLISSFAVSGLPHHGFDYEDDRVFAIGSSTLVTLQGN